MTKAGMCATPQGSCQHTHTFIYPHPQPNTHTYTHCIELYLNPYLLNHDFSGSVPVAFQGQWLTSEWPEEGSGRCTVRLDRWIAPLIFPPVLHVLFLSAFQDLNRFQYKDLWLTILPVCGISQHIEWPGKQINKNIGPLRADWVKSYHAIYIPNVFQPESSA